MLHFTLSMKTDSMMDTFNRNVSMVSDPELITLFGEIRKDSFVYHGGKHIMTDDKAPVELLGMKVIDSMIRDEVSYYKEIYRKEGLKGLIEALR